MAIRPILFNTEMVKAILYGRKTQTRRIVKPQPNGQLNQIPGLITWRERSLEDRRWLPPANKDDILWVRETWKTATSGTAGPGMIDRYIYKADEEEPQDTTGLIVESRWHPSIHMPWIAARIFLKVTDVRVERLSSITEDDAMKEGVAPEPPFTFKPYTRAFATLWDKTVKGKEDRYGWVANPWVWVIEFKQTEQLLPF